MRGIRVIIVFTWIYIFIHLLLIAVYRPLTGDDNPFPLYTWHIFRPDPIKYVDEPLLLIHELDDKKLEKPTSILDLKNEFKNIRFYDFAGELHELVNALRNGRNKKAAILEKNLESSMLRTHHHISYEVVWLWVDPIEFVQSGKYEKIEKLYQKTIKASDGMSL